MEKFTKGPWHYEQYGPYFSIQNKSGYAENSDVLNIDHFEEAEENAKLIAASPTMLEALKVGAQHYYATMVQINMRVMNDNREDAHNNAKKDEVYQQMLKAIQLATDK